MGKNRRWQDTEPDGSFVEEAEQAAEAGLESAAEEAGEVAESLEAAAGEAPELVLETAETFGGEAAEALAEETVIALEDMPAQEAPAAQPLEDTPTSLYVNKAKQMLADYQDAQKMKNRVIGEVKQCEKAVTNNEKSVADSISAAIKKRKEEIASSFDRELSGIQDSIDATKVERAKAKASAIAERIQAETAPLTQQNQELEEEIEQKFRDNQVPALCRNRSVVALFFPKRLEDWIIDGAVALVLLFLIPLFLVLGMQSHPVALSFVLFLYVGVIFGLYLYVLHHYMLKNIGVNDDVENLRRSIRSNNKTKQTISNRIKKSEDEDGYDLTAFDDQIASLQGQMEDTVNKRQDALDQFENEIRHQITAEITEANKEETDVLAEKLEEARKAQTSLDNDIASMEAVIRDEYEPLFGKDLLHKAKLDALAQYCQEHGDLSMEEAIAQYRTAK